VLAAASGRPPDGLLDFSANLNPLGPPDWLRPLLGRHIGDLASYPDPDCLAFREAVAAALGLTTGWIVPGNGVSELLFALCRGLGAQRAVVPVPAYVDYERTAVASGLPVETPLLRRAGDTFVVDWPRLSALVLSDDLVFLGRPNNPTGHLWAPEPLLELAAACPDAWFVVDETFLDFVPGAVSLAAAQAPNLVVLRSLTKFYAFPGLRVGYAVAAPEVADRLRRQIPDWSVGTLAQQAGIAALADRAYAERSREVVAELRAELASGLAGLGGVLVCRGEANFLLARLGPGRGEAVSLSDRLLLTHGIAIRVCTNFRGLDESWFRVAVRPREENDRLVAALESDLNATWHTPPRRRAKALMFQGTSSNAGKSWLTAAFCRILWQDGVRVAPFKAQNMSNNSWVARDGGEMGRAQVLQARACRLDPDTRMNPVLLKPGSDVGCQVIVRGQVVGNYDALGYGGYTEHAGAAARAAYDELAAEFDAVVLEGAGSPGEINLRERDIVNMRMARHADARVLLVGDIDRGGVYAAFVGTLDVLTEPERRLVAGYIVNKFRGDERLLAPAHVWLERYTAKPVLGVVPYLHDLRLPDEDAVEFRDWPSTGPAGGLGDRLDVAVVDLPHISNFDDFDPLHHEPDVALRVVRRADELGAPDAVLLPGTKNTIGDLRALTESGLAAAVGALACAGQSEIVGVCGGYQMLGTNVSDPLHLESKTRENAGLGLLPLETVLERRKMTRRVTVTHALTGLRLGGYEIHHGHSTGELPPLLTDDRGAVLGAGHERVWGTYVHGLFDDDTFRRWWLDRLRLRRGWPPLGRVVAVYDLEPALDRLAAAVRVSVDLALIYRLLGL
jgi:cobyric acid synthase CobQ/L-threonine-O-3-phosphate decarboxylase